LDVEATIADIVSIASDIESLNIFKAITDIENIIPAFKTAITECTSSNTFRITKPYKFTLDCITDVTKVVDIMIEVVKDV
jgi:hypothetical protein